MFKIGDKLINRFNNNIVTITKVSYVKDFISIVQNDSDFSYNYTITPDSNGKSYKTWFRTKKEERKLKLEKLNGIHNK